MAPILVFLALGVFPAVAAPPGPASSQLEPVPDDWDFFPSEEAAEHSPVLLGSDTGLGSECRESSFSNGTQLPYLPDLYRVMVPGHAWGTQVLAETLVAATQEMRWRFPQADPLVVGDLSRPGGGVLSGHRSHRGGRDADIGIYLLHGRQHPGGFRSLKPDEIDLEINLFFIRTLLDTGDVERVLLDQSLIRALRRYAIDSGAMSEELARATFLLPEDGLVGSLFALNGVVHHVPGHDNHFHIRVRCAD